MNMKHLPLPLLVAASLLAFGPARVFAEPAEIEQVIDLLHKAQDAQNPVPLLQKARATLKEFDPVPDKGPLIVEIYTSIAARAAGMGAGRSKIRDRESLIAALDALDCPAPVRLPRYDDHATDAIITAAWMRNQAENRSLWHPEKINLHIGATEGWTFGVI